MKKLSILLGLSGSEQSTYAADVAWRLTADGRGKICAQHIIDTSTLWELLRNDKPGFIGSSPYIEIYDDMSKSLRDLANKLTCKFQALSDGKGVETETIIEEGGPVERICERAKEHDLVIVGHQPHLQGKQDQRHWRFVRYAVAEGLAHFCSKPLLVVQSEHRPWKSMTILISSDHINFSFIGSCLELANELKLEAKLVALLSSIREEPNEEFKKDLMDADSRLEDVPVEIVDFEGIAVDTSAGLWRSELLELDWAPDPETLLVIPTRASGGRRLTVFDTTPDLFIRNLTLPCIMLWPEELASADSTESEMKEEARAT